MCRAFYQIVPSQFLKRLEKRHAIFHRMLAILLPSRYAFLTTANSRWIFLKLSQSSAFYRMCHYLASTIVNVDPLSRGGTYF